MAMVLEDNREMYAAHIAAREAQAEPEPLYDFAARVGLPADQPIIIQWSAHGDFAQAPDGSWRWVEIGAA